MGQLNQPTNLIDRVVKLERGLEAIRKLAGLTSAIIRRGGLTLLDSSFIKMVTSNGVEAMYFGPDSNGKQRFVLRREGGALLMYTAGSAQFGRDFWAMTDSTGNIIVSDNAEVGVGLARPWIPLPLYAKFQSHSYEDDPALGFRFSYMSIDTNRLAGESTMWEGRASVSHPWVTVEGVWGSVIDTPGTTYRLKFNDTTVGTWTGSTGPTTSRVGRFDVSQFTGQDWVKITLTVSASGTGAIACQVLGCYLM